MKSWETKMKKVASALVCSIVGGVCAISLSVPAFAKPKVSGEQQVWRAVTLDFEGPESSETATINPFTDYRFDVIFSQGEREFQVPGYFAACGNAAENGCEAGNIWRAHFTPDAPGKWSYKVSFKQGDNVILGGTGKAVKHLDGEAGTLSIADVTTGSTDPRDKGRLIYDGRRYLHYSGTGEVFFKAGSDMPENMLAYEGFDGTPNRGGFRKSWSAHAVDAAGIDLERYGWAGRGANILGSVAYLANEGLNAFSFLTFSLGGDDQNVFPHLLKVSPEEYEALLPRDQWDQGVYKTRFDVSKLDQWQRVWDYGNDRGMFLHFKLQELENNSFMDGGDAGIERTAYIRQIVARAGHYLALNWNNGEENTQSLEQERASIALIAEIDPYQHHRVTHTYSGRKIRYFPMLGDGSMLTGISNQGRSAEFTEVRGEIAEWVLRSTAAGKPWAMASDEQGGGQQGVPVDADYPDSKLPSPRQFPDKRRAVRAHVLWGTLTAGGYGVEYYGGYGSGCGDLRCEDHHARASKWRDAAAALKFWREHIGADAYEMEPLNLDSGTDEPYWFGRRDASKFVVYAHNGKRIKERGMAESSRYRVSWFDPTTAELVASTERDTQARNSNIPRFDLLDTGSAPNDTGSDWVLLIERIGPTPMGEAAKPAMLDDQFVHGLNSDRWVQHYKPAQFTSEDQVLIGRRLNPGHGATLRTFVPKTRDVVFEFDAQFSGASNWGAVMGDPDGTDVSHAGHIVRINVGPDKITLSDDRMGQFNHAIRALPQEDQDAKTAATKESFAPVAKLNDGKWHHYRLETRGDVASLFVDSELVMSFASPGFAYPGKQRFGFNVGKGEAQFDNVLIAPL